MVATAMRKTGKTERQRAKTLKKGKTALRGGLDVGAADDATERAAAVQKMIDQQKEDLRWRVVSEYWVEEIARNQNYTPDTPCRCRKCRERKHKGWPGPAVMGINRIAWECEWERTLAPRKRGPWEAPPVDGPEAMLNRWDKVPDGEAMHSGLTIRTKRQSEPLPIAVMVAGCARCEGMRIKGDQFCVQCAALALREMKEAGYL